MLGGHCKTPFIKVLRNDRLTTFMICEIIYNVQSNILLYNRLLVMFGSFTLIYVICEYVIL